MSRLHCNNCKDTPSGGDRQQNLFFIECGHFLCGRCLEACEDQTCLICQSPIERRPIITEAIDEDQLVVHEDNGGFNGEMQSSMGAAAAAGNNNNNACSCSIVSVADLSNVKVVGSEQHVELIPSLQQCGACSKKSQWSNFWQEPIAKLWNMFTGR